MFARVGRAEIRSSADPVALSNPGLEAAFGEAHRRWLVAGAERLRLLAEVERRGLYRADGFTSAHAWVAARFGESAGSARSDVRTAVALQDMPQVAAAAGTGSIPPASVRMLAQARAEHPGAFREEEGSLVRTAAALPADAMRQHMADWSIRADAREGIDRSERLREARHLAMVPTAAGMVRVSGELDPETAEPAMTAMQGIVDAGRRVGPGDHRTTAQRWADALGELGRAYLDRGPGGSAQRAHVVLSVGLDALRAGSGSAMFERSGPVAPSVARREACDASLTRVVLGARSEPLDVGRRTPVVPPAIRRALVARDGGCSFPDCDRPPRWTDAHHVVHWSDGGATALSNLVLLCREHHRAIHDGVFTVHMDASRATFGTSDGSIIQDGRAPP